MAEEAAARRFIEVFPEAFAWNVTVLNSDEQPLVVRPQCSRAMLLRELGGWLAKKCVHFFIRPLLSHGCSSDGR